MCVCVTRRSQLNFCHVLLFMLDIANFAVFSNHLTGTIPSELSMSLDLQILLLQNNHFHGKVPSEFVSLSRLGKIYSTKKFPPHPVNFPSRTHICIYIYCGMIVGMFGSFFF